VILASDVPADPVILLIAEWRASADSAGRAASQTGRRQRAGARKADEAVSVIIRTNQPTPAEAMRIGGLDIPH
jgi:hypothetical protein